jgi:glycosyltransferase involved in cell wall biosynthesis
MLKISLVTVTYNSSLTLPYTILSVLSQTYYNVEYIIVDGESKDSTVEIIKKYESGFNGRLKWVSEKDGGLYDAMNKGIRMSSGDIIGFLNSDDYFTTDLVLQKIVNEFEDASLDAIYGDVH